MANTIKIKRNTTNSDAPTTSDIAAGEIAFTEASQIMYYRDASDNIRLVGGEGAFLRSNTNDTMNGNLTITGNLTVEGTTTQVDSTTVTIADPQFKIASNNNNDGSNGVQADAVDFGTYGSYNTDPGGGDNTGYSGWFRDADDSGKIKWYTGLEV
ncbi:MAG: hypothetical protein VW683_02855, partial [Betaproteobacteria bacterium]